jgi:hypothetical protein
MDSDRISTSIPSPQQTIKIIANNAMVFGTNR